MTLARPAVILLVCLALLTTAINPDASALAEAIVSKHYGRKHGPHAYYGQS